jgi:hypothetical protein
MTKIKKKEKIETPKKVKQSPQPAMADIDNFKNYVNFSRKLDQA